MTEIELTDCGHCHDCGTQLFKGWCSACARHPAYHDGESICPPVIESPCNHKWCLTCRHWRFVRNEAKDGWPGPYGECEKIDEDSQQSLAWTHGSADYSKRLEIEQRAPDETTIDYVDPCLITMPRFGCVEWTIKDGDTGRGDRMICNARIASVSSRGKSDSLAVTNFISVEFDGLIEQIPMSTGMRERAMRGLAANAPGDMLGKWCMIECWMGTGDVKYIGPLASPLPRNYLMELVLDPDVSLDDLVTSITNCLYDSLMYGGEHNRLLGRSEIGQVRKDDLDELLVIKNKATLERAIRAVLYDLATS